MSSLQFDDFILDNIHGYISLTEIEREIEKLPVFRRLRGIKQLGLTNWVFPGAEHTRYSHSLGVMHIADKMALQLGFTADERQLIRLAGMLHDLGHYPLSHVGERAYRSHHKRQSGEHTGTDALTSAYSTTSYAEKLSHHEEEDTRYITHALIHKPDNPFHHESLTEAVIRNSRAIDDIFARYGVDVDDICAIITGDIQNERLIKFVQLLHAELDADRIDYLLRDTFSSGTAYGAFEINTLIKNLTMAKHHAYDVDIIGVNPKGILSADQFLINRYFAYSQVFYHKNVTILSYMGEKIIGWMLASGKGGFPDTLTLLKWIENQDRNDDFFNFTDSFFMQAIKTFDPRRAMCPEPVAHMIDKLNHYLTPAILAPAERHNVILSGQSNQKLLDGMLQTGLLPEKQDETSLLKIDETYLTEHVDIQNYRRVYTEKKNLFGLSLSLDEYEKHRLINGVAVIQNDDGVQLLHDAHASLVKSLCRHKTVFFRTYDMT